MSTGKLAAAVVLVLVLSVPGARAVDRRAVGPELPACLDLDVTLPYPASIAAGPFPYACDRPVELAWQADQDEGSGWIRLTLSTAPPQQDDCGEASVEWRGVGSDDLCEVVAMTAGSPTPIDASLGGVLRRWSHAWLGVPRAPSAPASSDVARFDGGPFFERTIVVTASFHARWSVGDCAASRGGFALAVDDETVSTEAPPNLFGQLCALSRAGSPSRDLAGALTAGIAAGILDEAAQAAPELASEIEPVRVALVALTALAGPSGGAVSSRDVPDLAASGGALLVATPSEREMQGGGALDLGPDVRPAIHTGVRIDDPLPALRPAAAQRSPTPPAADGPAGAEALRPRASAERAPSALTKEEPPSRRDMRTQGEPPGIATSGPSLPTAHGAARTPVSPAIVHIQTDEPPRGLPDPGALSAAVLASVIALAALALYQRFARPAALDHPVRGAIYAAVVGRQEGATAGEIGKAVGIGRKSAEYHLLYLAKLGLLRADRRDERTRVFASPTLPRPDAEAPLAERVLELAGLRSEVDLSTIIATLGVKWSRADACVKTLLLEGRLASRWTARGRLYRLPTERGRSPA